MKIQVVPVGLKDSTVLEYLVNLVSNRFDVEVEIGKNLPIETFRRNEARGQYLSTSILEILSIQRSSSEYVLLGVADIDLYVNSFNFVFGEADPTNRVAVISVMRLRQSFYGLQNNNRLFLERAGKEAVHELGHVLGLRHCRNPMCVMFFSNSLADTDRKEDDFCRKCRNILRG